MSTATVLPKCKMVCTTSGTTKQAPKPSRISKVKWGNFVIFYKSIYNFKTTQAIATKLGHRLPVPVYSVCSDL